MTHCRRLVVVDFQLLAFVSFPVRLSLADNLSVVNPNYCSVNIAEFVLARKEPAKLPSLPSEAGSG